MMRPVLPLLALASTLAAGDAAVVDEERQPLRVGAGYHLLNPDARNWTGKHGWTLGVDARLPFPGLVGTSHADLDWRANKDTEGRFDAVSLCYAERKAFDASGVYVGLGAGLSWNRLTTQEPAVPPSTVGNSAWQYVMVSYYAFKPDTVGIRPVAKLIAGYEWRERHIGVEAAYLLGPDMHDLRTGGLIISATWRFGGDWYQP